MFKKLVNIFGDGGKVDKKKNREVTAQNAPVADEAKSKSLMLKKNGNELLAKGDLDGAAKCYQRAIEANPEFVEGYLNLGFVLNELGKVDDAEKYLSKALHVEPNQVDVLFILSTINLNRGHTEAAITQLRKVLELNPIFDQGYEKLYQILIDNGKMQEAKGLLDKAIQHRPDNPMYHFTKGDLYIKEKEYKQAICCYEKACEVSPEFYPAFIHQGNAYKDLGDMGKAQLCYEKAIHINPDVPDSYNNLGALFQDLGDAEKAEICYRNALRLKPDFVEALNNLGGVLNATARIDEAVAIFERALSLKPESAEIQNNLGSALRGQGKLSEAEDAFQKSIALDPHCFDAYNNLATALNDQGRKREAAEYYKKSIQVNPKFGLAYNNLGVLYQEQGDFEKALSCYEKADHFGFGLNDSKMNLFYMKLFLHDWAGIEEIGKELRRLVREEVADKTNRIAPFSFLTIPGSTPAEHKICSTNWAKRIQYEMRFKSRIHHYEFKRKQKPKLNLGYVSADFRNHPVAHLMARVFELHDRELFNVFAYSIGPDDSSGMREKLQRCFDHFIDVKELSDMEIADKIFRDNIDILVNLTGYTQHGRTEIFTLRPAPVQVNYLGFPGTLGGDFFDYLIADAFIISPHLEEHYAEKVKCLPDTYMPRDDSCVRFPIPPRQAWNLPEDAFVFCSFNQTYKITPVIFDIWCRLLNALPDSVLWLPATNPLAEANLCREAEIRGVAPTRIIRAPRAEKMEHHLARMQCADLFLDTFPYNAHTTCSDALWVGLPVVTCAGDTFPSRVAGSLLTTMGLPELVTNNLEEYFSLALELATNKSLYEAVRKKVSENKNTDVLFNSARFARNLEKIYEQIWDEYRAADKTSA